MAASISCSGNGYIQKQHDCSDASSIRPIMQAPPPTPPLLQEENHFSDKNSSIEMTPMLQVTQNTTYPTSKCFASVNSKNSPNASVHLKESSSCQLHYTGPESLHSNMLDEKISESKKPLNSSNKKDSSFPRGEITPATRCFDSCCCSESDIVGTQECCNMTIIHYKVLTTFIGSCVIGLLCFILIIFINPQLFFKSKSEYID